MTETFTREELIERAEKAEAEVSTLLVRLKSAESALDRAMARSNIWREEAAKMQSQMLADQGRHIAAAATIEESRRPYGNDDRMNHPAETPRRCETCGGYGMIGGARMGAIPEWDAEPCPDCTPKPIPSTTDKGEKP